MRAWLVIGSGVLAVAVSLAATGAIGVAASLLVFLVVIVGPGVVVTRALTSGAPIGLAATAVMATGLGITVTIILGLILDRTPIGLSWLGPILAAAAAVGLISPVWHNRHRRPVGRLLTAVMARHSISYDETVLLLVAVALVTSAFAITRADAKQPLADGAQLWVLPGEGSARIGAANVGANPESWRVVAREDDAIILDEAVTLEPGQHWTKTLGLPDGHGSIAVTLLGGADGTPLREVGLAGDE